MSILKPDNIVKVQVGNSTLVIKQKIIPDNAVATKYVAVHVQKGQKMKPCAKLNNGTGKPKGITVHNTEDIQTSSNTTAAEQYTRATYPNCNMNGVVVHFYVYKSDIWQNLREDERGWHAADGSKRTKSNRGDMIGGNLDTIAIECIGNSKESEDTTAKLVAYLCKKYGLDPNLDVYTHKYFYPKKNCPIYIIPHWKSFISECDKYYKSAGGISTSTGSNQSPSKESTKPSTSTTSGSSSSKKSGEFLVKIICDTLNIRSGAGTLYKKVGKVKRGDVYTIVATNSAKTWGKLKSGAGWICIKSSYVKEVKK